MSNIVIFNQYVILMPDVLLNWYVLEYDYLPKTVRHGLVYPPVENDKIQGAYQGAYLVC